jgi:hypothetical protein
MKHPTAAQSTDEHRSPYLALNPDLSDEHPVDVLVEKRAPQRRLRRRIRRASRQLMQVLAGRRDLWLGLEAQLAEYRQLREQAYFDVGFEHGFAAGQAHIVGLLLGAGVRVEQLAARVREQAILDDQLSPQERALALLQAAWAVGFARDVR